jgi:uncharacterized membrane protein YeiH
VLNPTLSELSRAIDLTGVFTNAVLGGVVAREFKMDPVGFVALALVSGLGGGVIRDTLLQHGPPVALTDSSYVVAAVAGAASAFAVPAHVRAWTLSYPVIDALALGTWAAAGAQKTLGVGLGWLPAVLLGTVSAVGGGALRDIAVNRIPQIFGGNTLYATCAASASALVVVFTHCGLASAGTGIAAIVGSALCLLARWRGWQLDQGLTWDYAVHRSSGIRFPRIALRGSRSHKTDGRSAS